MSESVAYPGAPGAFAEEACRRFLPDRRAIAKPGFADVAQAVAEGEADLGMLPCENSSVGPVPGIEELIRANRLTVRAHHALPIRHHLMALPGVSLNEVRRVASHPIALAQCRRFLEEIGVEAEGACNTALAAKALQESGDRTRAVIASEAAAATYGLTILRRDVHDRPDNATTFCVVARTSGDQGPNSIRRRS